MTTPEFGFYFERAGLGGTQGAIAPAEQYFEGSRAEVSVVRETGQNSIDADDGSGPVRMEFELGEMKTDLVPGIDELREHLAQVKEATRGTQGHDRMVAALEASHAATVSVLRISDYGTKGLTGTESLKSRQPTPLSALTRGAGISANDGTRGGSFGIGSAVGPMASDLCTVFYTSLPVGTDEVVFAGYSRLATHKDASGVLRGGDGFYTHLESTGEDFRYLRNPDPFGPFQPRTEAGTDIYIVGYRKAADDPLLHHIRDAAVDNFMMAIHEGRLEVTGKGLGEEWLLNAQTLETHASERPDALAFYRAIGDPRPATMTSARFGEVRLYINVDPSMDKTLHTITTRRPLMRIDTFRFTSIPAKYAAILVCADASGNTLLRTLEPPQHDTWDGGRAPRGNQALKELKDFVRQALKDRVKDTVGDIVEIKGLARFLPSDAFTVAKDGQPARPGMGDGSHDESATVQGDPDAQTAPKPQARKKVAVRVQRPATNAGASPITKEKDKGGPSVRKNKEKRTGLPGTGEPGDGRSRIPGDQIRFRSWAGRSATTGSAMLYVALTAREDSTGDLELITLGAGGAPEPGYALPILSAEMVTDSTRSPISWEGNVFKDVRLSAGKTTRLDVEIEAGHRYRLDVK